MNINERRLRKLFGAHGFRVREIRNNKHWVATVKRNSGGRFQRGGGAIAKRWTLPSAIRHVTSTCRARGRISITPQPGRVRPVPSRVRVKP